MLTDAEMREVRRFLLEAKNPLFLFDDDCDGLCSYLILKRYCQGRGKGLPLKAAPNVDPVVVERVHEANPDLVVLLDRAIVNQDFLDKLSMPVVWLDHHAPLERKKVHYYNPRVHDAQDNRPTTALAYAIAQQDLWIAAVGCVADWYLPDFLPEFKKQYPGVITKEGDPGVLMFETPMGRLIKIFYFLLKGKAQDVRKSLDAVEKLVHPDEILKESSVVGKLIVRQTRGVLKEYDELVDHAKKELAKEQGFVCVFVYPASKSSFTSFLSNELSYVYPDKLLIIGREKEGEIRLSMRNKDVHLPSVLERALVNVHGHGGGHEHACGAMVVAKDFERFVENIKREVEARATA